MCTVVYILSALSYITNFLYYFSGVGSEGSPKTAGGEGGEARPLATATNKQHAGMSSRNAESDLSRNRYEVICYLLTSLSLSLPCFPPPPTPPPISISHKTSFFAAFVNV